jgi:hypothetical protein
MERPSRLTFEPSSNIGMLRSQLPRWSFATPALVIQILASVSRGLASTQVTPVNDLLSIYAVLDEMCRGWSGDDPHTNQVCSVREKVGIALKKMGYCSDDARWHKCAD